MGDVEKGAACPAITVPCMSLSGRKCSTFLQRSMQEVWFTLPELQQSG